MSVFFQKNKNKKIPQVYSITLHTEKDNRVTLLPAQLRYSRKLLRRQILSGLLHFCPWGICCEKRMVLKLAYDNDGVASN